VLVNLYAALIRYVLVKCFDKYSIIDRIGIFYVFGIVNKKIWVYIYQSQYSLFVCYYSLLGYKS